MYIMTTMAAVIDTISVMANVCTVRRPHDGMNTSLKVITSTAGIRATAVQERNY